MSSIFSILLSVSPVQALLNQDPIWNVDNEPSNAAWISCARLYVTVQWSTVLLGMWNLPDLQSRHWLGYPAVLRSFLTQFDISYYKKSSGCSPIMDHKHPSVPQSRHTSISSTIDRLSLNTKTSKHTNQTKARPANILLFPIQKVLASRPSILTELFAIFFSFWLKCEVQP